MTDDELNKLKDLPAPPPRAEAKTAALAAAMAAFDAAEKNSADATQGKDGAPSHMHASEATRRQKMRAPMLYKIAAGVAVVLVATPAALYVVDRQNPGSFGERAPVIVDRLTPGQTPADQLTRTREAAGKAGEGQEALASKGDAAKSRAADPEPAPEAAAVSADKPADEKVASGKQESQPAPEPSKGYFRSGTEIDGDQPAKPKEQDGFGANRLAKTEPGSPEAEIAAAPPPPVQPHGLVQQNMPAGAAAGRGQPAPTTVMPSFLARPDDQRIAQPAEEHRDQFESTTPNPVKQVATEPVSTFSIDVDTASYGFARRELNEGRLPQKDAVRVEELINYFPYAYPRPETAETPFQPTVTVMPAPWKPTNKLVHIGIKGYELVPAERPRANIVLLIDISGSMQPANRLPLVKNAFRLLIDELKPDDTVGIVTCASGSGIALEPTKVSEKGRILAAIDALGAGGSTAGAAGISDAYRLAEAHFDKEGVNRIILATDGDFNVGISNRDELKGFIERKREAGIFLSILGVGQGNYNDALTQALAQNGNGTAAYVDTLNEARKVLVDEASSTLFTIAKDVKIQVEFNPAAVSEYRLIGYETRSLRREDFNNDKVDAGDIGSGHTVTAIYEVTPMGAPKLVDDLRYRQPPATEGASGQGGELGFLKLRYKLPKEDASKLVSLPIAPALEKPDIASAPEDVRFSVAVAAFGQLLRGQHHLGSYGFDQVQALAQGARGADPFGYRAEFASLVRLAKSARP